MAINYEAQKHIDIIDRSIQYRGKLLHNVSYLEMVLNAYIANYFCKGNSQRMSDMIVIMLGDDRVNLRAKADIFYNLATTYDRTWFDAYVSIRPKPREAKKPYNMNQDLVHVIEQRNIMAHRILDYGTFSKEAIPEDVVRFATMKNEIKPNDYSKAVFDELINITINLKNHFEKKVKVQGTYPLSI